MDDGSRYRARAYTLLELVLAVGLLLFISAMAIPNFINQIKREELPSSARQLRSLLTLVRANAAFDGKRYRIRFPNEDEAGSVGDFRQPLIEREDDPLREPEVFNRVTTSWATGATFVGEVRCAEVRLGRPTIEEIKDRRNEISEVSKELARQFEDLDPERPWLDIDPDGGSDWAAFVLTDAPGEVGLDELEEYPRIEVVLEGPTGLAWLQRPFYEEELDLFEEKGWPAVLRKDFLDPRVLTEDDVLELGNVRAAP